MRKTWMFPQSDCKVVRCPTFLCSLGTKHKHDSYMFLFGSQESFKSSNGFSLCFGKNSSWSACVLQTGRFGTQQVRPGPALNFFRTVIEIVVCTHGVYCITKALCTIRCWISLPLFVCRLWWSVVTSWIVSERMQDLLLALCWILWRLQLWSF